MKFKLLPVILILLFGVFATSALAEDGRFTTARGSLGTTAGLNASPSAAPKVFTQNNLDEKRLKLCQTKEKTVQTRFIQLARLVVSMEGKFDAIALRVENFYNTKVLAKGKVLSNYTELTTDIANKKVLIDTALAKVQTDSKAFSCEGGDPKSLLYTYRLDMQAVKEALHNYRTSIKNLIVAVHTLVGDADKTEPGAPKRSTAPRGKETPPPVTSTTVPTGTPKPSEIPVVTTATPTATP